MTLIDPASVETYLSMLFAWAAGDLDRRMPEGWDGREFYPPSPYGYGP